MDDWLPAPAKAVLTSHAVTHLPGLVGREGATVQAKKAEGIWEDVVRGNVDLDARYRVVENGA